MKPTQNKTEIRAPRSARKNQQILLQNRNENGETSPGLQTALKLAGTGMRTRPVVFQVGNNTTRGLILAGEKRTVLWIPDAPIRAILPHARLLGADWAINWNFGIEVEFASPSKLTAPLPRRFDRSR